MIRCSVCGEENPERARFCLNCGNGLEAARGTSAHEVRKTVSVVFADITGSTSMGERLDPEATRALLARYFGAMREVIERHGGTVEKFIGDAVMAVFGVPTLHEDDALRAVRAASDMRERLEQLNVERGSATETALEMRIGVNTGEVVAGQGGSQVLVTGDAVNVAARLEQAASPGEILIGATTEHLVRAAVKSEAVEPLSLKGKSDPVPAFRLLSVTPGAGTRIDHLETPLVGRQREMRLLREAFERAVAENAPYLFTLLGSAGVGKSRLVHELTTDVGKDALVLRGRCLPYGEGITYWPIGELVRTECEIADVDSRESATAKLADRLGNAPRAQEIAAGIAAAIGLSGATGSREEIFWAIRRFCEHLATERPLIVVLDDLQWAEPTLVELVEHLVELSHEAPILMLCVARPELLERHPGWGGGQLNATTIMLEPLRPGESTELIGNLCGPSGLPATLADRVADAAEGNPLFVEEFVAMLRDEELLDSPSADLSSLAVPSSVQALISARLDRLEGPAREVIGRASVIGKAFDAPALRELTPEPDRAKVADQLRILVRRELVRRDLNASDEDAYRFRHILVRDTAYGALPKELRADLHERHATWLETTSADRLGELEEIIGYHLAQAHAYRAELGLLDAETSALAERAIAHLEAAGRRARDRGDAPAAGDLYNRAVALAPAGDPRRAEWLLEVALGAKLAIDFDGAERACMRMREEAEEAGQPQLVALADMTLQVLRTRRDPTIAVNALETAAAPVEAAVEEGSDDLVAAVYWITLGEDSLNLCRWQEATERDRQALAAAVRLGHATLEREARLQVVNALIWGPTPSAEVAREVTGMRDEMGPAILQMAVPLAQQGKTAEAHQVMAEGLAAAEELGLRWLIVHSHFYAGHAELAAGSLSGAEQEFSAAAEMLAAAGETGVYSTATGMLACVLAWGGRIDEAAETAERSRSATAADDLASHAAWRMAMAIVAAARGEPAEGERLAREAVEIMRPTDFLDLRGDSHRVLADVLEAGGRSDEARAERQEALRLYEAKEVLPKIEMIRALIGPSRA